MLNPKYTNPLDDFQAHGVKTVGSYDYVLLVDETGFALIMRVASDTTTIKFKEIATPVSTDKNAQASAIDTAWETPDSGTFVYLFQLA